MVFDMDYDRPHVPAIARILSILGIIALIGSIACMLLAFSRLAWVNPSTTVLAALGAFVVALLFMGQAKIMEQLALVNARVKSRFAMEHTILPQTAAAAPAEPKLPPAAAAPKERVISIPEHVAREQGLTPVARTRRDFP